MVCSAARTPRRAAHAAAETSSRPQAAASLPPQRRRRRPPPRRWWGGRPLFRRRCRGREVAAAREAQGSAGAAGRRGGGMQVMVQGGGDQGPLPRPHPSLRLHPLQRVQEGHQRAPAAPHPARSGAAASDRPAARSRPAPPGMQPQSRRSPLRPLPTPRRAVPSSDWPFTALGRREGGAPVKPRASEAKERKLHEERVACCRRVFHHAAAAVSACGSTPVAAPALVTTRCPHQQQAPCGSSIRSSRFACSGVRTSCCRRLPARPPLPTRPPLSLLGVVRLSREGEGVNNWWQAVMQRIHTCSPQPADDAVACVATTAGQSGPSGATQPVPSQTACALNLRAYTLGW